MEIAQEESADGLTISTLTGVLPDQASLARILGMLYDLGFALLSLECVGRSGQESVNSGPPAFV